MIWASSRIDGTEEGVLEDVVEGVAGFVVEEVAQTALYLCSPMSSGMTGDILYVDAGYRFMAG